MRTRGGVIYDEETGWCDMVSMLAEVGQAKYARHCPSCGKWARTLAGDDAPGGWSRTSCKKCGVLVRVHKGRVDIGLMDLVGVDHPLFTTDEEKVALETAEGLDRLRILVAVADRSNHSVMPGVRLLLEG